MCDVILAGLERAKRSDQWRRGIRPHPSTWLNNARWNDEDDGQPEPPTAEAARLSDGRPPDTLPEFDPLQPDLWTNALHAISIDDPDGTDTWLRTLQPLGRVGDEIWIGAQSAVQRNWVASNYREQLSRYLRAQLRLIVV